MAAVADVVPGCAIAVIEAAAAVNNEPVAVAVDTGADYLFFFYFWFNLYFFYEWILRLERTSHKHLFFFL